MVLYSKFTYGSQFSEEQNNLEICCLGPEILNKYKRSIFFETPCTIQVENSLLLLLDSARCGSKNDVIDFFTAKMRHIRCREVTSCPFQNFPSHLRLNTQAFQIMKLLKNTAWFEVNQTFGCREIIIQICCGPFAPSAPRLFRVNPNHGSFSI